MIELLLLIGLFFFIVWLEYKIWIKILWNLGYGLNWYLIDVIIYLDLGVKL